MYVRCSLQSWVSTNSIDCTYIYLTFFNFYRYKMYDGACKVEVQPFNWTYSQGQIKSVCEVEHQSVRVLLLVPILLARLQTVSFCPNYPPRGWGRSHSYCCRVDFSGEVIVIATSPRFGHACACHAYPCTYETYRNSVVE